MEFLRLLREGQRNKLLKVHREKIMFHQILASYKKEGNTLNGRKRLS